MDQITNHAITRFYGDMDPETPWEFLKIRETCHPYTPYVAQALLQKHLSDELVDMVLVFYDEAQVREWRWKRTEAATAAYVDALKAEQAVAVAEAQRAAAQALEDTAALRDAYADHLDAKGAWEARESEEVQALRAENGRLAAQVDEMREGILTMQVRG